MPVPILLVAGFLGAGKTTVVNHLLAHAGGRRIAAVVNDFGAINIDAELIAGASDGVVSLSNGCICCSLEGDLLRTLANLLRRDPRPEAIVIETSGVAEPSDIVRNLMDPVIWREAPLETVLCVVDATATSEALEDPLFRAQLRAADVVALSKVDLAEDADRARVRAAVKAQRPAALAVDAPQGRVPLELLFPDDPAHVPAPRDPGRRRRVRGSVGGIGRLGRRGGRGFLGVRSGLGRAGRGRGPRRAGPAGGAAPGFGGSHRLPDAPETRYVPERRIRHRPAVLSCGSAGCRPQRPYPP